jgi:hypothetical protein
MLRLMGAPMQYQRVTEPKLVRNECILAWWFSCRRRDSRLWTAASRGSIHPPWNIYIYKYGEAWWNDVRRKLIRPPELSGNPTKSHLVASRRNTRKERWIWPCEVFFHTLKWFFLYAVKSYTGPSHPKERVLRIFIALKTHRLGRVWTCEPWVRWQAR